MTIATSRAVVTGIFIFAVVLLGFLYYSKREGNYSAITTFLECKQAGFQVMESYPERCQTPDGRQFVNENATSTPGTPASATGTPVSSDRLRNLNVSPNQILASPFTFTGEARGLYFEASFPVELIDGNGKRLFIGPAQAQGDWMTSEFVPFSITLTFAKPVTATGTLIIYNDNPSGLPENQYEYRIPVRFSTTERTVGLYYYDARKDVDASGNVLCSAKGLVAVSRNIPVTQTPLQDAIRLLLRGELTAEEKASGITTEFPLGGVSLVGASLSSSGNLTLALADPQARTSGGACRAQVLRAQVEATARQFPEVKSVTFSPGTVFQP